MKQHGIAYLATAVVFLSVDVVWLTLTADRLYRAHLSGVFAEQFNWAPAVFFYALYPLGIVIFAVSPALREEHWWTGAIFGGLFGFFAYATYDLTNHATIKSWPVIVTVADLCWGTVLTATAATCGYLLTRRIVSVL